MAEVKVLEWPSDHERFTVDAQATGITDGVWVTPGVTGLELIDAVDDVPVCLVVEEESTETPQRTLKGLGNGTLADLGTNITAAAPGTVFFSDGDGTISSTEPNPGAGSNFYQVGHIEGDPDGSATTTRLRIAIMRIQDGAA